MPRQEPIADPSPVPPVAEFTPRTPPRPRCRPDTRPAAWAGLLIAGVLLGSAPAGRASAADAERLRRRRSPVVEVVQKTRDAVVSISATKVITVRQPFFGFDRMFDDIFQTPFARRYRQTAMGSGFVLHRNGYIVTNAHVVSRAADLKVVFADGSKYDARIISIDPKLDLAVLKIDAAKKLPHVILGRSDDLMIGETVIAIGNPLGYQNTVSTGVISATGRVLRFSDDVVYRNLIQTDAAINPGNSGGPLLNINGELIGINTAIRGDAQNMGFAIPVDDLKADLPALLDVRSLRRADLGLRIGGTREAVWTAEGRSRRGTGIEVAAVTKGSPADSAGIRPGDLIVAVENVPVESVADLFIPLIDKKTGQPIAIELLRGGKSFGATVRLKALPKPDGNLLAQTHLGMKLHVIDRRLAGRIGVEPWVGLLVHGVEAGGPAARAGIEDGDIVYQLQQERVRDLEQVGLVLETVQAGQRVYLGIWRIRGRIEFRQGVIVTAR